MELLRVDLIGRPARWLADEPSPAATTGIVGLDLATSTVDDQPRTVVQLLFDDDRPGFDRSLLDGPVVAELVAEDGAVMLREPLDHDHFRRRLHAERQAGESVTRGVLVLTDGELPPPWVRLAFLPLPIEQTDGAALSVRRTTRDELVGGVEGAHANGAIGDEERTALLTVIDQLHPPPT